MGEREAEIDGTCFKPVNRRLEIAVGDTGSPGDKGAISYGIRQCGELTCLPDHFIGVDGGTSLVGGDAIWGDEAEIVNTEIAHRARYGANVQWVTGGNQDNAEGQSTFSHANLFRSNTRSNGRHAGTHCCG